MYMYICIYIYIKMVLDNCRVTLFPVTRARESCDSVVMKVHVLVPRSLFISIGFFLHISHVSFFGPVFLVFFMVIRGGEGVIQWV